MNFLHGKSTKSPENFSNTQSGLIVAVGWKEHPASMIIPFSQVEKLSIRENSWAQCINEMT